MSIFGSTTASVVLSGAGGVSEQVGSLFGDLWPYMAFAVAIPLTFYVIKQVIGLIPKAHAKK